MDFYIDPGGPGSHPGVPRTDSGAEKYQKIRKKSNQFEKIVFISIQGVQGAIPEGPEPIPELKNDRTCRKNRCLLDFYIDPGGPGGPGGHPGGSRTDPGA